MNSEDKGRPRKKAGKEGRNAKPIPSASHSLGHQTLTIRQALEHAVQHHTAGRLSEAESIYQQILQAEPNQPTTLRLLGVVAHQMGKNDGAVDLITKALAIKPDYAEAHENLGSVLWNMGRLEEAVASFHKALVIKPDYADAHSNLGNALRDMGRLDKAITHYHKALAIEPTFAEVHNNLGNALRSMGRPGKAVASFHKALAIKPDFADAHCNLGNALRNMGKLDEAVASYHKALATKPEFAEAHNNLGNALTDLGRLEDAVVSYRKALAVKPNFAEAHSNLGNALQNLGKLDKAVASFHKALSIKPDYAEAHNNLGNALTDLGRPEDAVNSFRKALAIKPDSAAVHNNIGNALRDLGKLDEAVASYHKALDIKPDFAEARRHMARIKKYSEYDEDIRAMEQAYAKSAIKDEQRMHLAFSLGKAFEDLHQYDKAFDFFAEGNSIKRGSYSYSIDDHGNFFKKLEEVFDPFLFAKHQGTGCDDVTPIFILGMPRSGTTLVEQILASHRQVHGAGELRTLRQIVYSYFDKGKDVRFPESVRQVDSADFERSGVEYIQAIRKHSPDTRFITDKMPENFKYIGLIKLMLPDAKVIHCRRDPADTCLSIFKTLFTAKHEYAHDLGELGRYHNFYRGLMEHWRSAIPGFIHEVQYEDMVADQAGQTRTLLEYCGLEWDDACLEFHKLDRPVMTASAEQVRRPIYRDSVQLWKRYETQLAPLLESFC
jgi:tetratricopeptide (TPR) repeat protein